MKSSSLPGACICNSFCKALHSLSPAHKLLNIKSKHLAICWVEGCHTMGWLLASRIIPGETFVAISGVMILLAPHRLVSSPENAHDNMKVCRVQGWSKRACLSKGYAPANHLSLRDALVGGCLGCGQLLRPPQHLHSQAEGQYLAPAFSLSRAGLAGCALRSLRDTRCCTGVSVMSATPAKGRPA